jgi:hypothetical protein
VHRMFTAVCVGPCLWQTAHERALSGRARNAARGLGRQAAGLRNRSRRACCEVPRVGGCRARRTAAGRGWLNGCALRRAAGCTGRVLRRWSAGAMRRRDPVGKRMRAVLLPGAHRPLRIRAGVCRQRLTAGKLWLCLSWLRSARGRAVSARSRRSAFLLCGAVTELAACPAEIFGRRHILLAKFPGAQLAQRLSELAIGIVGCVLRGPP